MTVEGAIRQIMLGLLHEIVNTLTTEGETSLQNLHEHAIHSTEAYIQITNPQKQNHL